MTSTKFDTGYYALLAKRIRSHDKDAFTELYNATYNDLYRYALYFLKDSYMAQDALQEVYVSIYKNVSMLKSDKLMYSWIRQITYHICCNFLRKNKNVSEHETGGLAYGEDSFQIAGETDDFQTIYDEDLKSHLEEWLEQLPIHPRQAFTLRYGNNLKLEEIADFMHCSLSSVKRYISAAQEYLRMQVSKYHL